MNNSTSATSRPVPIASSKLFTDGRIGNIKMNNTKAESGFLIRRPKNNSIDGKNIPMDRIATS
tara:strand:- start:433 stop:621 length:189 start_codon:yes stop_codon:yes gene_type:complete